MNNPKICGADLWVNTNVAGISSQQAATSTCRLYTVIWNNTGAACFLHVYDIKDGTTLGIGTAVPLISIVVPATSHGSLDFGTNGRRMKLGCFITSSATAQLLGAPQGSFIIDTAIRMGI